MLDSIKTLFSSKKFYLTIIGSTVVIVLTQLQVSSEVVMAVAALFGVNALGQGLSDLGKNAPQ